MEDKDLCKFGNAECMCQFCLDQCNHGLNCDDCKHEGKAVHSVSLCTGFTGSYDDYLENWKKNQQIVNN